MGNIKTYYVMLGDEGSAVGLPLNAKVDKSEAISDGFVPSSTMHRLFNTQKVYLLDTDTGCMLGRPVCAYKAGFDWAIQIGGVEQDAIIRFPKAEGTGQNWWIVWNDYDPMRIDGNLTFFDVVSQTEHILMPFDDNWDLCVVQYKYNKLDPVRSFRYYLAQKTTYKKRLISEDIHLCKFIQRYCELLAKLQNRAALLCKSNVEEYADIVTLQLTRELDALSDDDLGDLPCGIAVQSLRRFAETLNSINFLYSFSDRTISFINDSFAFCFDITVDTITKAEEIGYPFLFAIIGDTGDLGSLLAPTEQNKPTLSGRIMNSRNNEIIHF